MVRSVLAKSPVSRTQNALPGKTVGNHSVSAPSPMPRSATWTFEFRVRERRSSSAVIP